MVNGIRSTGAGGAPGYIPSQDYIGAEGAPGHLEKYIPPQNRPSTKLKSLTPSGFKHSRGLHGGTLGANWGCSPRHLGSHPTGLRVGTTYTFKENENLRFRVEMAGDPAVGTLIFIRQWHLPNYFITGEVPDYQGYQVIGNYHKNVFAALESVEAKHVFVESLDRDFPGGGDRNEFHNFVRRTFPQAINYLSDQDSPEIREQKITVMLAWMGGAIFYALKYPEISLWKTMTPQEAEFLKAKVKEIKKRLGGDLKKMEQDIELYNLINDQRESWALRQMIRFFRENPGEKAALVYGGGHRFCDDFARAALSPQLISVWWKTSQGQEMDPPEACY